jgi:hypothetical protein
MSNAYNGWTNYETWNAKLWMDNDEGSQGYWAERAQQLYNDAEADHPFTRDERATLDLSDELKHEHEANMPELEPSFYSDILNAALSEVNWYEIAESLIGDVDKEAEVTADAEDGE